MYPELHNRRVLLGNRDEFLLRPASRAAWRSRTREHVLETDLVHGNILCGVDLLAGGTWMGITRSGSFAALTNVYEMPAPQLTQDGRPLRSRGELVMKWLDAQHSEPGSSASAIDEMYLSRGDYGSFNLLVGDLSEEGAHVRYISNRTSDHDYNNAIRSNENQRVCGLSNSPLQNPWPKVELGEKLFQSVLSEERSSQACLIERLFNVLQTSSYTRHVPVPEAMRHTIHVSPMKMPSKADQMHLSSTPNPDTFAWYGTRTSTVILVSRTSPRRATFVERDMYSLRDGTLEPISLNYHDESVRSQHERKYEWELPN